MDSRAARLARGWLVGTFATLVAAGSHALAGGGPPSALALLCSLVFAGMLGTLAMGRRPSLPRLAIAAGGSQFAFHAAFSFLAPAATATATGVSSGGHLHSAVDVVGLPASTHVTDPAMWLGHAVAAIATIAFLSHAERALWSLLRDVVARVAVAHPRPMPVSPLNVAVAPAPRRAPRSRDLADVLTRRGPPVSRFG